MSKRAFKIGVAGIGLVMMVCIMARTVSGKEQRIDLPTADAYERMEAEHIKEIRTVLSENHFSNSGVNMTKVIDADENRVYTVEIYHMRLNDADQKTKQELLNQLELLDGFGAYCTVEYKIAM